MSPATSFCLTMLITLSATKDPTDARYHRIAARNRVPAEMENLKLTLNYVRSEQESCPSSIVSLVFSDLRSDLTDLVSEYVAGEPIVSYRITTSGLSRRHAWQSRVDLTWIMIINDLDVLDSFVREHSHIWKSTNQYLIIVTARSVATLPQEIYRSIWGKYSVYRIAAVTIGEGFRCLSRFLPFEKDQQNEYGVVRKNCLMDRRASDPEELCDKLESLNGYPIRVLVFPSLMMNVTADRNGKNPRYSKLDANAMSLLQRAMGAEFRVKIVHNFGREDPFHLALRYIENGHSEMIVTSFFVNTYKEFHMYEFTTSVYEDKLCLLAPAAGFIPKSYMPILPFTSELWAALAICNLIVSVAWFLVKYYSESFRRRRAVLLPLMQTRGLFAPRWSDSVQRAYSYVSFCFDLAETWCYPLNESGGASGTTAQRIFLLSTLFFSLVLTGLYHSCLVSNLNKPFRYPELDTLEDVADSNLTIITKYYNLQQNTFTENTTLANRLKRKIRLFTSDQPTNNMVAFGNNIALVRYASLKLDNMSSYYDENGNELLHIVEECPTTYLLSYVVRLYSPYRERVNTILLRMQQAGLIGMWYANMTYPMHADEQRRGIARRDRRHKLTLEHYSLTFLSLSLGLLVGAAVFIAELYFARRAAAHGNGWRSSGRLDDDEWLVFALPHYHAREGRNFVPDATSLPPRASFSPL